jgi:hypothetical protein
MASLKLSRRGGGRGSSSSSLSSSRKRASDWEELEPRRLLTAPTDIDGVQPFSIDQPFVNAFFRRTANGAPLTADDGFGGTTFNVADAFLDTGTSSILLSLETWQALGIQESSYNGQTVTYSDVGVGGSQDFSVSEPLYTALAPWPGDDTQIDNPDTYETYYNQKYGPLRIQLNREPADDLIGPLDIFGMPVLQGKVMVFKPSTDVFNLDLPYTYIYNPGTPFHPATVDTDPGIPLVNRHVKLSYADTSRFTEVTPSAAQGPVFADNPFIGPDPTQALSPNPKPDNTPPVSMSYGTHTSTGSFLFDTGAQASFISLAEAQKLGVHYKPGTYNNPDPNVVPVLLDANNNEIPNQFQSAVGGIGGSVAVAGFYMDSLTLPTVEGQPIRFLNAPVLVTDVTVADPITGQTLTLDGDFGVNFISISFDDNFNFVGAPFPWVTFDQPNGLLGFDVPDATALPPSVVKASFDDNRLPQKLTFTFSEDVTGVTGSSLVIKNTATQAILAPSSFTYDPTLHTATATFNTEIPDGGYTARLLQSAITDGASQHLDGNADGTGGDDYVLAFTHLVGDANHDGVVNYDDMVQVLGSGKYNTGAPATWADGDFNYDGKVDAADLNRMLTFGHYNQPPAGAPAASAAEDVALPSAPPAAPVETSTAAAEVPASEDSTVTVVTEPMPTSSATVQQPSDVTVIPPVVAVAAPPTVEPAPVLDTAPPVAPVEPEPASATTTGEVATAIAAVPPMPVPVPAQSAAPACDVTPPAATTEDPPPAPAVATTVVAPAAVSTPTSTPHARRARRHQHHHSDAANLVRPAAAALPPSPAKAHDDARGQRHKRGWEQ